MIKFNFSLPDDEAELLLDIIRENAGNVRFDADNHTNSDERTWLLEHANLIYRMANTIAKGSSK